MMAAAPEGVFAAGLRLRQAEIAVDSGRYADAAAHLREVRRLLGDVSDDQFLQPLAWMEAETARAQGDLDTARRVVAEGLEGSVIPLWRYAWPLVWLGTRIEADAATRHRDLRGPVPDDVATRAAELATLAHELPAEMPQARAYRALVTAERVRLECAPGLDAWSAAAATCRDPGEPYLLSYALLRLAAEAFPAGERDAGIEALRESAALAARIGAAPLVEEATALARRARVVLDAEQPDAEPPPAPVDPLASFGLTAREREILSLIAAGLSNGQIATELFISPKTASVHVSRILAKLGVSGRVEAAAVVHRLGLLRPEGMPAGR
jgi:DNA-binding CsgD family transcriptional regulator